MNTNNTVLIAKNVPLTARLTAREIYVSSEGSVTIIANQFGPNQPIPKLTAEYLDAICSRFYYGKHPHQNAIADIMLLNGILTRSRYDDFYLSLRWNLENQKTTIIYSHLFQ